MNFYKMLACYFMFGISVLIYEPNHPTALQFQPVLEDKILIGREYKHTASCF